MDIWEEAHALAEWERKCGAPVPGRGWGKVGRRSAAMRARGALLRSAVGLALVSAALGLWGWLAGVAMVGAWVVAEVAFRRWPRAEVFRERRRRGDGWV